MQGDSGAGQVNLTPREGDKGIASGEFVPSCHIVEILLEYC